MNRFNRTQYYQVYFESACCRHDWHISQIHQHQNGIEKIGFSDAVYARYAIKWTEKHLYALRLLKPRTHRRVSIFLP